MSDTAVATRGGSVAAVVLFSSPNEVAAGMMQQMIVQFGLTQRESQLAAEFGRHANIVAAAEALGITVSTARQCLKAILEKTGVHTQARLLQLIGR